MIFCVPSVCCNKIDLTFEIFRLTHRNKIGGVLSGVEIKWAEKPYHEIKPFHLALTLM